MTDFVYFDLHIHIGWIVSHPNSPSYTLYIHCFHVRIAYLTFILHSHQRSLFFLFTFLSSANYMKCNTFLLTLTSLDRSYYIINIDVTLFDEWRTFCVCMYTLNTENVKRLTIFITIGLL